MDPRVRPIQSILKDLTDVHQPLLKVIINMSPLNLHSSKHKVTVEVRIRIQAPFAKVLVFRFEPEMIPAAMLAHRIMGIMAHWREHMGKKWLLEVLNLHSSKHKVTVEVRIRIQAPFAKVLVFRSGLLAGSNTLI
jgi:citrate synthase